LIVLNGINASAGYSHPQPLELALVQSSNEALEEDEVGITFFHGATDAGEIDLTTATNGSYILNNLSYGAVSNVLTFANTPHEWKLKNGASTYDISRHAVEFDTLGGKQVMILSSGFLNPELNNNGEELGLWLSL